MEHLFNMFALCLILAVSHQFNFNNHTAAFFLEKILEYNSLSVLGTFSCSDESRKDSHADRTMTRNLDLDDV